MMTRRWQYLSFITTITAILAGCNLAPFYQRPVIPAAVAYKEQAGWHTVNGQPNKPVGAWWQEFNDPLLNQFEQALPNNNQNLQAALARYDEARAALLSAKAGLLPIVNLDADATREQVSETTKSALSSAALSQNVSALQAQNDPKRANGSSDRAFNDLRLGVDASYDVDLWGRLHNAVVAAGAEAQASREDAVALLIELQAELATAYFTVRADDAQISILDQSLRDYQAQLDYTRRRYQGGIALISDVDQAETQLDSAQAQKEQTLLQRAQTEHALAVLIGSAPGTFNLTAAPFIVKVVSVDTGVPSSLLERRPDIVAAEQHVISANAAIGEARAAWYPDIEIDGTAGFESQTLSRLFSAPSSFWSLGPSLTQPIFEGGLIIALNAQAKATYNEVVANYRQTVLSAYQEVEDNIAGVRQLGRAAQSQQAAAAAASRALVQANDRYQGGIDTYVNVTLQENTVLQARLALTQTQLSQVIANVRLIKALGGDIQQPLPPAPK